MNDASISTNSFMAGLTWLIAVTCVVTDLFTGLDLGELGILFGGAACVLNVKGMIDQLAHRERNAYLIGRDSRESSRR